MLLWLAAGSWFLVGFVFGWITGTPALRSFGAIGTVVFFGIALLVDYVARSRTLSRHDRRRDGDWLIFDASSIDWSEWPDYRDEERAA